MTRLEETIENPLLLQNPIEKVDSIEPSHVETAICSIIERNKAEIKTLVSSLTSQPNSLSWDSLIKPLEIMEDRLGKAWSPVSHLNSVCNTDELRGAYDKALALLTDYSTELGQHQQLFELTNALYESKQTDKTQILTPTRRHILKDTLRGYKLSGLHLEKDKQQEFSDIQKRLAELSSKYEQNLMDATMAWTKEISNQSQLTGLPKTELAMLANNATLREKEGYLITLEIPSYLAIMTYANDRQLREDVYTAYSTRASDQSLTKKFDNSEIMSELLQLKAAKAKLLGFDNYAELSLESKMANSPEQVIKFLAELSNASRAQALNEYKTLADFAKSAGSDLDSDLDELKAWDIAYFSEKLKQEKYQISQSELRPYFVVDKVIDGLFGLTQHLYDVSFEKIDGTSRWHKDVIHYSIKRDGETIAEFYLDLYARRHKRGGAWMDSYQSRFKPNATSQQIPIAYLTCNFAPGVNNQPAQLTHDEVVTLFHEFGHGLHHMLTQVNDLSASGIANVPWDAVELPSQFMENFCYQPEIIEKISGHIDTGKSLPKKLLEKLIAAKNFQSAMMMVRQIEFSLFDIRIHSNRELSAQGIQNILDETRAEVAVVIPPSFNRFQNGFSHIFAGGYSAGYYSYKWAEVLSADAFSLFEKNGVMDKATGASFLGNILEKGGSADPMELFENFRGRKPELDALLQHSGIAQ
ncbi:MAG: M3 family metallopeptidase [Kangiellaceae bacterium]|nr:M3 family metallopeptidase [Kangiellaceae bacterium]